MTERKPPEYNISLDDELPESIFTKKPAKPAKPIRPARPVTESAGRRMPLLVVVALFAVMLLAVTIGYIDIKESMLSLQTSGSLKAENLAVDLQSKFSALSLKFAALENEIARLNTAVAEKTTDITKTTTTLRKAIDSFQKDMEHTRGALDKLKAGNDARDQNLAGLAKELATLQSAVKPLESSIKDYQAASSAEIKRTLSTVSSLQEKTADLTNQIESLNDTNAALAQQQALMDKRLKQEALRIDQAGNPADNLAIEELASQVRALKVKLSALEQLQKKQAAQKTPVTFKPVKPRVQAPASRSSEPPYEEEPAAPKPGEVIEQDIR